MTKRWLYCGTMLLSAWAGACAFTPSDSAVSAVESTVVDARALRNDELLRLAMALNHPRRVGDYQRDSARRPFGVVSFMRLRPDMTIVEASPGDGWYTRVLAPYVAENGRYMALNYSPDVALALGGERLTAEQRAELASFPAAWPAEVKAMMADTEAADVDIAGAFFFGAVPEGAAESADAVTFFDVLHDIARFDQMEAAAQDAAFMLKPGGLLGVVQPRASADAPDDYADGSQGYLREVDVVAAFEAQGFTLIDQSDLNANADDPADWPDGMWSLPPTLRTGENEERYRAIGEPDRMTLLFRKPL